MKVATILAASALALAVGSAYADDRNKGDRIGAGDKGDPGFNALDKDNDGSLSRAEAAGNPDLARQFKTADKNGDGKLSRIEYLAVMTKKDLNTAKEKVTGERKNPRDERAAERPSKNERTASRDRVGSGDKGDPGFNALDKDNDGSLSRTEAAGNPDLMQKFGTADKDNDGKLSRAEYLAAMTKKDAKTAKNTVKRKTDEAASRERDRSAATGASARGVNEPNAGTRNPNPNARPDSTSASGTK